jgi:MOSC domain-containing protein YiiM
MQARIASINVSGGGVPKHPVPEAFIRELGVAGDHHADLLHHGGPDRAVSLYAAEVIDALAAEGHPIRPGSTGENLTVAGLLPWSEVVPGVALQAGGALLLVTSFVTPCHKIAGSFTAGAFERISHKRHPGWSRVYARVLEEGIVRVGDAVELAER